MSANILVATPKTAFGELLRLSLEESGRYHVRLAQTPGEVRSTCGRVAFDLAILDASLDGQPLVSLAHELRAANYDLRLVVIPPENDPSRLDVDGLSPDAFLSLPFYAPDLLETVSSLLAISGHGRREQPGVGDDALSLGEQAEVAEQLGCLLGETSAKAVFILRQQGLWASAGEITSEGLQELAVILGRAWDESDPGDLARFARLAKGGEVMLYATALAPGNQLALVFEPNTPLMRIRGQASLVTQGLRAARTPQTLAAESTPTTAITPPAVEELSLLSTAPGDLPLPGLKVSDEELAELMSASAPTGKDAEDLLLALQQASTAPGSALPAAETLVEMPAGSGAGKAILESKLPIDEEESPEVSLTDLLAAMPPPNPEERSLAPGSEWIEGEEKAAEPDGFLFPWEMETQTIPLPQPVAGEAPPALLPAASPSPLEETVPLPQPAAANQPVEAAPIAAGEAESNEVTRRIAPPSLSTQPTAAPAVSPAEPTQPLPTVPDLWRQAEELETPPSEFASLSYTCVMLPRIPGHLLTGRLARKLAEWLKQICLAYGWRLEGQSVRPDYFQWTVQVSPVISPSSVVRLVRLQTSQRIFGSFGRYAVAIPSGDFWAPGYLIVSGSQPPDPQLIRDYIQQTRKRQGL